jgi:hypothetical protein
MRPIPFVSASHHGTIRLCCGRPGHLSDAQLSNAGRTLSRPQLRVRPRQGVPCSAEAPIRCSSCSSGSGAGGVMVNDLIALVATGTATPKHPDPEHGHVAREPRVGRRLDGEGRAHHEQHSRGQRRHRLPSAPMPALQVIEGAGVDGELGRFLAELDDLVFDGRRYRASATTVVVSTAACARRRRPLDSERSPHATRVRGSSTSRLPRHFRIPARSPGACRRRVRLTHGQRASVPPTAAPSALLPRNRVGTRW